CHPEAPRQRLAKLDPPSLASDTCRIASNTRGFGSIASSLVAADLSGAALARATRPAARRQSLDSMLAALESGPAQYANWSTAVLVSRKQRRCDWKRIL